VNSPALAIEDNYWMGGGAVGVPAPEPASGGMSLALGSNPIRGGMPVTYTLPREGTVRIEILDLQGRVVAVLDHGRRPAGSHRVAWPASNSIGRGVYFVRLRCDGDHLTRKVIVLE
jgi:hypothetical protein